MSAGSPSVASDPTRRQSFLLRPPFVPAAPLCPAHLGRAAPPQALGVSSLVAATEDGSRITGFVYEVEEPCAYCLKKVSTV
ncbi:hypothetical protein NDU88_003193 [Pleurodeles waltl]|uniref:Gamma-glutamylcyclotransferase family protein n=1 Tax=Pleurodeles waltl TaxID=8319 RepID=A0AAV7QB28_PLEWA|nr:hypothetical protein NDU88_003193 [Pleurodeles waltl]